jgi:hypothetical protein
VPKGTWQYSWKANLSCSFVQRFIDTQQPHFTLWQPATLSPSMLFPVIANLYCRIYIVPGFYNSPASVTLC